MVVRSPVGSSGGAAGGPLVGCQGLFAEPTESQIGDGTPAEWEGRRKGEGGGLRKKKIPGVPASSGCCGSPSCQGNPKLWTNHRPEVPGVWERSDGLIGSGSGELCRQSGPDLGEPSRNRPTGRRMNLKHRPFLLAHSIPLQRPARAPECPSTPVNRATAGRDWSMLRAPRWTHASAVHLKSLRCPAHQSHSSDQRPRKTRCLPGFYTRIQDSRSSRMKPMRLQTPHLSACHLSIGRVRPVEAASLGGTCTPCGLATCNPRAPV